jgi:hypothetical protein
MKSQILKIAGVKSEKEFYKLFPDEASFMKKHGKAFKKAQFGSHIGGDYAPSPNMVNFNSIYDEADLSATGMTDAMRKEQAEKAAQAEAASGGGGIDIGSIMSMVGGARNGTYIPKAYYGTNTNTWWDGMTTTDTTTDTTTKPVFDINKYGIGAQTVGKLGQTTVPENNTPKIPIDTNDPNWMNKDTSGAPYADSQINKNYQGYQGPILDEKKQGLSDILGGATDMLGPIGGIIEGIDAIAEAKEEANRARQSKDLSALQLIASQTRPEQRERRYVRPEDVVNTGEEFFPIYGVGTNALARNGARLQNGGYVGNPTEIQNTYGDYSIYDDLEYEPLFDQQKSFRQGGYIPKAQSGIKETGWQRWKNSMAGKGSGFSGSTAPGTKGAAGGGTPWGTIGTQATSIGQSVMGGQSGGGKIGRTAGKAIGSIFGPVGGAVGEFIGGIAGQALDPYQRRIEKDRAATKRNVQNIAMNQMAPSIQAGYASHMKDGGWVSNDWTPQVIAKFGDLDAQDYARFAHKDEFRAGGHLKSYTDPSQRAMQTYENGGGVKSYGLGGELQTHWGGGAEPMSYNPYLPGSGETVMFRGKSHEEYSPNGETGIGVTYGGNPVEVERGEPMIELEEGGQIDPQTGEPQKSGVVFGNLKIPNQYIDLLGDKKAKGKKFKNYVADLSKEEENQNKLIEKSTKGLETLNVMSSFDKLKLSSYEASIKGANMKLKEIADKKINAAHLQSAINDTAEEYGLVADDLARGKVKQDKSLNLKQAMFGTKLKKAQDGTLAPGSYSEDDLNNDGIKDILQPIELFTTSTMPKDIPKYNPSLVQKAKEMYAVAKSKGKQSKEALEFQEFFHTYFPEIAKKIILSNKNVTAKGKKMGFKNVADLAKADTETILNTNLTGIFGERTEQFNAALADLEKTRTGYSETALITDTGKENKDKEKGKNVETKPVEYKRSPWIDFGNEVLNYLRPSDQEELDYNQLMGEMYALSNNQLEPVQAQLFKPELSVPYDVSFQDMLNENQADYNAAQRMMGYNPAAQANLNAQKYMANQKVLGEQFRANQAMRDKVYGDNRNILNQAKLTNLGILDKQYERQSQAMSNTKATTQAALNSISDKYAKNRLENRTLGVYENLYNYRYNDRGRAVNMNGMPQWDMGVAGAKNNTQQKVPVYGPDGNIDHFQYVEMTPEEQAENNKIPPMSTGTFSGTKATNRNGSIVKAIKNL